MPTPFGASGTAEKAANGVPSADSSVMVSWDTAAPAMAAIGGRESVSKHMAEPSDPR